MLQFFVATFDAARAALTGDVEGSLRTIESIPLDRVPPTVRELATRLHVIMLVLAGRAEEAVSIGRSLRQSSNVLVQSIPSMLRWAAGDPSEYLVAAPRAPQPGPVANHPYRFFRAAHGAVVAASLGDRSLADGWRREMEASIGSATHSRDSSLAVAVQACCKILDHDEDAVKSLIASHLVRHPLTDAAARFTSGTIWRSPTSRAPPSASTGMTPPSAHRTPELGQLHATCSPPVTAASIAIPNSLRRRWS